MPSKNESGALEIVHSSAYERHYVHLLTLSVLVILMIISISIHYDAATERTVTHTIQLENLYATVAMATIHDCA